eukprot:scaffold210595_cov16-Tisochrysis_lutea.AAC.1
MPPHMHTKTLGRSPVTPAPITPPLGTKPIDAAPLTSVTAGGITSTPFASVTAGGATSTPPLLEVLQTPEPELQENIRAAWGAHSSEPVPAQPLEPLKMPPSSHSAPTHVHNHGLSGWRGAHANLHPLQTLQEACSTSECSSSSHPAAVDHTHATWGAPMSDNNVRFTSHHSLNCPRPLLPLPLQS